MCTDGREIDRCVCMDDEKRCRVLACTEIDCDLDRTNGRTHGWTQMEFIW